MKLLHRLSDQPLSQNIAFLTALKMSIAGVLAFCCARILNSEFAFWAVVSVAAVVQSGLGVTYTRGLMRLLGTFIGALVGYGLATIIQGDVTLVLLLFFIFITMTSFIAIQSTLFSYAGTISGVTAVIILAGSLAFGDIMGVAVYRSMEVALGVIILFVVNYVLGLLFKHPMESWSTFVQRLKLLPGELCKFTLSRHYLFSALRIAAACSFTFLVWLYFRQPGGFWATVVCLLGMEESTQGTTYNVWKRFLAHLIAVLVGGGCALLLNNYLWWHVLPLAVSFFILGYWVGKGKEYSSVGATTGVALAIMLLADLPGLGSLAIVYARFLNVMFGIFVALLVSKYLWPDRSPVLK